MSPVETILQTTMNEIKKIVDVNTIVGDPIYGEGGAVVLPVSKVSLGFFTGGGDFPTQAVSRSKDADPASQYPFLGASVVGVTITPKAFLCMRSGSTTLLCADCDNAIDRLVQMIPGVIEEAKQVIRTCREQTKSCDDCCED
ncbi:MAG: sporulation protein YtfJ [Clostridia bacterium]|nr:sporulation protein YtfJ [Clostridia bacterium]